MEGPDVDELLGRSAEMAALRHGILAARQGSGGLVLVSGEAGIGRSWLLHEVANAARDAEMTVLVGRAVAGGGCLRLLVEAMVRAAPVDLADKPALAPFRHVLAGLLPGWSGVGRDATPAVVDPVVVLGEAVLALLSELGGGRGALLAVDDLHLADADSLALLHYLAGQLAGSDVLVVGAFREGEVGSAALRPLVRDPAVLNLPLRRLIASEVAAMAMARTGSDRTPAALDQLTRYSDGIPMLVEGLLAAEPDFRSHDGSVAVPAVFLDLVVQRLDRLDASTRDLVRIGAVLGRHRDWPLVAQISGLDEAALAAAVRAADDAHLLVLAGSTSPPRWRNAMTRAAILATMLPPEITALARRCADAVIRDPMPDDQLELAAHLATLAGRRDEAVRIMLTQARLSVDAGALPAAEATLRRAEPLADRSAELHAEVVIELVRVLALAGRPEDAIDAAGDQLAAAAGPQRTALCLNLARAAVTAGRYSDADRYLALAPAAADPRVDALCAHIAMGRGEWDDAARLAETAAAEAERRGMPEAACEALEIVGRYQRRRDPHASAEAFLRSERLATAAGLATWRIRACSQLAGDDLFLRGRRERLDDARRLAVDAGMPAVVTALDLQLGQWMLAREGFAASREQFRGCAESARRLRLDGTRAKAMMYVAAGRLFADEMDDLDARLDEAMALAPHDVDLMAWFDGLRGFAAWLDGDLGTATTLFGEAVAALRGNESASPTALWGMWALLRGLVDPTDGAPRAELAGSDLVVHPNNLAALHYAGAMAAAADGRQADARRLVGEGDAASAGYPYWQHVLHCVLAEHAARFGYGQPALWLRGALAFLGDTGEVRLRRRCRQIMRRLGLSVPRHRTSAQPVPSRLRELGVTPREAEVLGLIGLRNDEIACRLNVSPRTVEAHVTALLAKTGSANRRELGSVLRDP